MGLRINTNQGILSSLRNLQQAQEQRNQAISSLSSGSAITQASQNPSGLVLSEILRSDIQGINRAIENSESANNLLRTASSGLEQISNQLSNIRSAAVRAQNGALSGESLRATQDAVDSALDAIDRIADTTRFGGEELLNGQAGFQLGELPDGVQDIRVSSLQSSGQFPRTVEVDVTAPAERAEAGGTISNTQSTGARVRITGERGSEIIDIEAGASRDDVEEAINAASEQTGVEAESGTIQSTRVGSEAMVRIEELEGDLEGITEGTDFGADIQGTISGDEARGVRNTLRSSTSDFRGEITFEEGTGSGSFDFEVQGGGLTFQLGAEPVSTDQIRVGIPSASTNEIGDIGAQGSLRTLQSGEENSLLNNPGAAVQIADRAINQISSQRGDIGSVQSQVIQTNREALESAFLELTETESEIRDADVARVTAENLRASLITQAGLNVLRSVNFNQGSILNLLG